MTAGVRRLRFRYAKLGKVRFTSQRDVARMWERALRRTGLQVAWSGGFSPRPLLSFGLALPTGCESLAEYIDVALDVSAERPGLPGDGAAASSGPGRAEAQDALGELAGLLTVLLPEGISVIASGPVGDDAGSLQQDVTSCSWEMEVAGLTAVELATRVEQFLAAPSVTVRRERKGRYVEDDLRPAVHELHLLGPAGHGPSGDRARLAAEVATQPRGVRPRELAEGLGADVALVGARRTHQWIERDDGGRHEPLPGSGPAVVHPDAPERVP